MASTYWSGRRPVIDPDLGITAPQVTGLDSLDPWLEQALDPMKVSNGLDLSAYMQGVSIAPGGFGNQAAIDANKVAANTILSRLYAERPELFRDGSFTPWASFGDWNTRQNTREGFNEGSDIGSFISGGVQHIGDTASELWSEPGVRTLIGAGAAGAMMGPGPAGSATGGTAAGGAAAAMPAAVPETAASLAAQGLAETAPGVFDALAAPSASAGAGVAAGAPTGSPAAPAVSGIQTVKDVATILTPALSLAAAASGMSAARAARSQANQPSSMILPPAPQPVLGGPNTILATRGSVSEQLRRRGRAATIMTEPQSETLGA